MSESSSVSMLSASARAAVMAYAGLTRRRGDAILKSMRRRLSVAVVSLALGFAPMARAQVVAVCGNGAVEVPELCDDANLVDGDGCDSNCTPTMCGNGVVTAGEECDDGNLVDGDCCSPVCVKPEPPARLHRGRGDRRRDVAAEPQDVAGRYLGRHRPRRRSAGGGRDGDRPGRARRAATAPAVPTASAWGSIR